MKYSIWTNLDNNLIIWINKLTEKYDIKKENISFFWWFPWSNFSLNRYLKEYENITFNDFIKHISFIIKSWYEFIYLFNSLDIKLDRDKKEIDFILELLKKIWVKSLTITNLELIEYVNNKYKDFRIFISTVNKIYNIEWLKKYLFYKSVKKILLAHSINYDMVLLKEIVYFLKDYWISVELVGNEVNFCDLNCDPCIVYDSLSKKDREFNTKIYNKNWKKYSCCWLWDNPLESTVIIPEIIKIYDDLWISNLKIGSRMTEIKKIIKIMNQYFIWESTWNLYDLLWDMNRFKNKYFDVNLIKEYLFDKYKNL